MRQRFSPSHKPGDATRAAKVVDAAQAAVIRAEPNWNALPPSVPASIRQLLQRCLVKDRKTRLNDAGVLRYVLDEPTSTTSGTAVAPAQAASFRWRRIGAIVATAAAFMPVGGYVAWKLRPAPTRDLVRFTIPLRPGTHFTATGRHIVAISPNGRHLAFVANNELYVRPVDSFNATPIPTTRGVGNAAGRSPFFSPDSQWIGFWQDGQLKKVPTAGGAVKRICDAPIPSGVSWGADRHDCLQ